MDYSHGPRAADFVADNRESLFAFLSDAQVRDLAEACRLHSDGHIEAAAQLQACWDADRLDLGRVNVRPKPQYLCTPYARQPWVIQLALHGSLEGYYDDGDEEPQERRRHDHQLC
jgi:uncharacterized protein